MNKIVHKRARNRISQAIAWLAMLSLVSLPVRAAEPKAQSEAATARPSSRVYAAATAIEPSLELTLGQSHLIKLPAGASLQRVKVDDEKIVQIEVTSTRDLLLHGKKIGSTVVVILDKAGQTAVMDVRVIGLTVAMDARFLQAKLQQLLPNETHIKVMAVNDTLVLSGVVSDAVKVDKAMLLAEAYSGKDKAKKVINMLQVAAPQQVMLEVKMAEVSKNILDKLGAQFNASRIDGGVAYAIAAGFLSLTGGNSASPGGSVSVSHGNTSINVDAENKAGIVKILAEPNIIAISGQEGSFLAGGKIFIPVPQANSLGSSAITLEEKEFGVGLKFTPTVLEGGLINLKVSPEVSELAQSGTEVLAGGGRSVLPSFITRRVSTTVQLQDGQSFAIAGLIKNNVTETIRRFPILGDIPVLGALFRSSEFQNDKTELIFVITPRLVKPLPPNYALPTDHFNPPTKEEFFLRGELEGKAAPAQTPAQRSSQESATLNAKETNGQHGFEVK